MPLVISFWLRSLYTVVDTAYAASLDRVGDASVAAIGLTVPLEFLMTGLWVGTSNGLTARLAAAMGAGEGERIAQLKQIGRRIQWALVTAFFLVGASMWWVAPRLGLEPVLARQFQIYSTVLLAGSALTRFWSVLPDSLVKSHNDTKSTMWAGLISGGLNVALNSLFVFVFHWGIFGIAISTVVGSVGGLFYAMGRAAYHERNRIQSGRDNKPGTYKRPLRAILTLAIPSGISFAVMAFESMAINGLLVFSADSQATLAAWSIFDRAARFLSMPLIAVGVAILPFVARLWGEGDLRAIQRSLRSAAVAGGIYALVIVTPACFLLGGVVSSLLVDSPKAEEYTRMGFWILPLATIATAPFFPLRSAFEGMQQSRPGLVVSLVRALLFVIPLSALGYAVAAAMDQPALYGVYIGSSLGLGIGSLWMWLWMGRFLRQSSQGDLPKIELN